MSELTEVYKTMDLALRVGELLLSSGAGAADVSAQMNNVGHACGLRRFTADVTFTELSMSLQVRPDEPAIVQLRQVRYRDVDYGDLTSVDHLVRDLAAGRVTRDEAATRLNAIVSSGHARPRWSVTIGWGLMGSGVGMVLNGDWKVVLVAFVAACCIDRIQRRLARNRWPTFYQQAAGGLFASLVAAGLAALHIDTAPGRVITASIILLLAGVSFLGAIQDALTGFPLTAGARLLEAVIATAGAVVGVSGGITVTRVFHVHLGSLDPGAVTFADLPVMTVGGALAAAAYAFAAYAPIRALLPIAVITAAAVGVYVVVLNRGFGIAWASGVAAVLIGLVSFAASGRVRVPPLVVVTAAIVPLLPGLSIYRGLILFREGGTGGLTALATARAIAIALSAGVLLGEFVAQPIRREARRLESKLAGPRLVGPLTVRSLRKRHRPER